MLELLKLLKNYDCVGVRSLCDDEHYNVGDYCRHSYDWDCENDVSGYYSNNQLSGTCAIEIVKSVDDDEALQSISAAIKKVKNYNRSRLIIIAGNSSEYGNDDCEVIINNAVVLANVADINNIIS